MKVTENPHFFPGPYTRASLQEAPPFAVLHGAAHAERPVKWAIFDIEGCSMGDEEQASEVIGLPVCAQEPECDDELRTEGDGDHDAALAYLQAGGTLCKVHDCEGIAWFRLLVVDDGQNTLQTNITEEDIES